jgi:aryl-alcohol dehydrogenase-like predicted oxidoreductase
MEDQDDLVRSLARYYGHSEEDAFAARDLLGLTAKDFVVRYQEVAHFARTFGLNIRLLAELIAKTGTGIDPWQPSFEMTPEDYERVHEAEERLAKPGDSFHTILALLDEVDGLREDRPLGTPDGDDVS